MRRLLRYVFRYKFTAFFALACAAVNIIASLIDPIITRHMMDDYIIKFSEYGTEEFVRGVVKLLLLSIGVIMIGRIAKNIQEYLTNVFTLKIGTDIYSAGMKRWQGRVLMGMTDLGGNLDVLSTFRPSEKLLLDLYDEPEEVKRLTWEAHEAWHQYYGALNEVLQPMNPGYSDWTRIYSDRPSYVLQCDFCYMISPDMFDAFVKPELTATCNRLSNAIYHLDGPGQLRHLDSLLTIDSLRAVQWVPGDGHPSCAKWPEVYRKIRDAGKLIQLAGGFRDLDVISAELGSAIGIHLQEASGKDPSRVRSELEKWGLE